MGNLSIWLSNRLNKGKQNTGYTGAVIAVLGVAFALAVMEITLSVSVGFKEQITNKLKGFVAPISVTSAPLEDQGGGRPLLEVNSSVTQPIAEQAPGSTIVKVLTLPGMIKTTDDFTVVLLKGYEKNYKADFEKSNLKEGSWLKYKNRHDIVLSSYVGKKLNLKIGDKINFCFFINGKVKTRPFNLVGLYDSGFTEYDKVIAYVDADYVRGIYQAEPNEVTSLEVKNVDLSRVGEYGERLRQKYIDNAIQSGDPNQIYDVNTVLRQGSIYLNWLDLLSTNVVVIFILMTLVAASTLVSSLFIQVLEKVNAIGLLRALGARNKTVSKIFIYVSLKLVGWGLLLGNLIGLGFIFIQGKWHIMKLNPEMYYLDSVPVETLPFVFVMLNIGVIIVSWFILILPARIAVRLSPASTLRFD